MVVDQFRDIYGADEITGIDKDGKRQRTCPNSRGVTF